MVLTFYNRLCFASLLCVSLTVLSISPADARPFGGPKPLHGMGASWQYYAPSSDQSLVLSYRFGSYSFITTKGFIGEAGYRFGRQSVMTSLGGEYWITVLGLRLDAVVESDFQQGLYTPGIACRGSFGLSHLVYLNLGGQHLYDGSTEFVMGIGFSHLGGVTPHSKGQKAPTVPPHSEQPDP